MSEVTTELRVLAMYGVFATAREPRRLSDLASELGIATSSCFALVRRLVAEGYLYEVAERGGYYPTEKLHERTKIISAHHPVLMHISSTLQDLHSRTNETVALGRRDGAQVLYLAAYESQQDIRLAGRAGYRRPLYANSSGKALLGGCTEQERKEILAAAGFLDGQQLRPVGPKTLMTLAALEQDIKASEARGWYLSDSESLSGTMAMAVRISLALGNYAIQVAGPRERMHAAQDYISGLLVDAARTIGATHYGEMAPAVDP